MNSLENDTSGNCISSLSDDYCFYSAIRKCLSGVLSFHIIQAIQMVDQIHTKINEMAKSISWMDDKTRLAAVKKVLFCFLNFVPLYD